ncbi:hypothetical protein H6F43_17090 [Leptolyngbya sp. FACHB-36]|uniref:PsbP-related protein n=1 Tax=Leptolyngbya sp. FACHB-36 TaxID=2692808 RepID=UPI0016817669|nr:PsbP-related protein [Leptolyngbya sp. FACHB-36]MBD2021899.1 hypothetical protein [Leptolyngbya sp. FACHB-36]
MKKRLMIAIAVGAAVFSSTASIAQEPLQQNRQRTHDRLTIAQSTTRFKTQTEKGFSFQYPANWRLEKNSSEPPYFILTSYRSQINNRTGFASAIKTDISLQPGSMEQVMSGDRGETSRRVRTERLTIGGRQAVRRWIKESGFDFPDVVVTYIRYSDRQTAVLASYYTASNSNAVPLIRQIHQSFKGPR